MHSWRVLILENWQTPERCFEPIPTLTLRQEDVPPDAIMLIEFSSKLRHWMSPEDASPEEIIAYIHSMQTDPTCHT